MGRPLGSKNRVDDTGRKPRVPFGARRDRLAWTPANPEQFDPVTGEWHAVWLNDDGFTIQEALAKDYVHVTKSEIASYGANDAGQVDGSVDSQVAIKDRTGMRICLMKIKRELWEQDEEMRQADNEAPYKAILEKPETEMKGMTKEKNFSVRDERVSKRKPFGA